MPKVTALHGFEHGGPRKRGEQFEVSPQVAEKLERAGLVEVEGARPKTAAGTKSSASRAARASRRTTSKRSDAGATKAGEVKDKRTRKRKSDEE